MNPPTTYPLSAYAKDFSSLRRWVQKRTQQPNFCKLLPLGKSLEKEGGFLLFDSPFDTKVFQRKTLVLETLLPSRTEKIERALAHLLSWAKKKSCQFLFTRLPAEAPAALALFQKAGFFATEFLLTFASPPRKGLPAEKFSISDPLDSDTSFLCTSGKLLYPFQRLAFDPYIPPRQGRDFYNQWMRANLRGRALKVLVAREKGVPIGFVSLGSFSAGKKEVATIELIAVSPSFRRKGVARALVEKALEQTQSFSLLQVGTSAANRSAIQCYQHLGFLLQYAQVTLHCHLEQGRPSK